MVIVGGGFGGLHAARGLARTNVDILLIDKENHHCFQPLLYQVATAALSPADISNPIRTILHTQDHVEVAMGEVTQIDLDRKRVVCPQLGTVPYDYLVLAAGATHAYFGHDEWEQNAPGLKSIDDALEIRRRTLLAFEAAELEQDDEARRAALTFVVVGGGPTGIELAGALREIAANSIPDDFRHVDTTTTRIVLVEGQKRLLPAMSEAAGEMAKQDLEALGVEVRLNTFVTGVDERGVNLGDERLVAGNVFWAAGVRAASVAKTLGVELDRAGRVPVRPDCSLPGHPDTFAIGDIAAIDDPDSGKPVPGVAQGAMQMGDYVARIIHEELSEGATPDARPPFKYRDKGSMATIGKARAVADLGTRTFGGLTAWLLWCFVHVMFLVTFRNRLFVLLNWAYNYVIQKRGARLITGGREPEVQRLFAPHPEQTGDSNS